MIILGELIKIRGSDNYSDTGGKVKIAPLFISRFAISLETIK